MRALGASGSDEMGGAMSVPVRPAPVVGCTDRPARAGRWSSVADRPPARPLAKTVGVGLATGRITILQ